MSFGTGIIFFHWYLFFIAWYFCSNFYDICNVYCAMFLLFRHILCAMCLKVYKWDTTYSNINSEVLFLLQKYLKKKMIARNGNIYTNKFYNVFVGFICYWYLCSTKCV